MNIANQIMSSENPLVALLGDYQSSHVGFVYSMDFVEACVLTNDAWKERVAGVPHNSFLVAGAFNPESFAEAHPFDQEVVLLRVLGPSSLPSDADLLRTRIEHNQRRTASELFTPDANDGLDPVTHGELQYGALKCRILGTFYMDNGELRLGSDLENYVSSTRLRVFKPRADALANIVNHINPEVRAKALKEAIDSGFSALPTPIKIGEVRYTSTARLHRGPGEPRVPVMIQPSDFLGRRTAVLGMTRTGKSNTVKTTVAAVSMAAMTDGIKVGQIIFDINGEYANANHQDDGSSIADVFDTDCVRYRAVDTAGFEDLRTNFYLETNHALNLIQELFRKDTSPYSGQDLDNVMSSSLEEPDPSARGDHNRWAVRQAAFQCILHKAGYKAPAGFQVTIPHSKTLRDQITRFAARQTPPMTVSIPAANKVDLTDACAWFELIRLVNLKLKAEQKAAGQSQIGLESSTAGNPWVDATLESYLNFMVRETSREQPFGGYRAIVNYIPYHSPRRMGDVVAEILAHLEKGKIVILDLSAGPVSVRTVLSKRIAEQIFNRSFKLMNEGKVPPNMVIYVEEAHNLIGKKDDLTDTWPRLAKEGAKAKIAFVYATQEPSSIHPNILANTENWFVTHLNNDDELRALGKFYDFADFHASLKTAQDVGFARIKTLSSPYVIPTQIDRFTPDALKAKIARIKAGSDLV
ncbi:ATP-binding protein [Azonexus sp.]|uniref:ATP-binding protein n=1 Tax=Azonexus sp. TaxID=1872668 RepID=UPI0035B3E5A8